MKPQQKQNRKTIDQELRKTHYTLGYDQWNYLSQYRHDYPPYPFDGQNGSKMDSVMLRKTNFKLGDYVNPYSTTAKEQSRALLEQGAKPAMLDEEVKNDLRRCHFRLGNNEPNFQTEFQQEYYDKSGMQPKGNVDFKDIERKLRQTSYILGNDKPDYVSEAKDRFGKPDISKIQGGPVQKISTAELQKSHYTFGTDFDPWTTTQHSSYIPKAIDTKPFDLALTKTHFKFGDDQPPLTSINHDTYIKHPICMSNVNKELSKDLRRHHFYLGNESYPDNLQTVNHQDYIDPKSLGLDAGLQKMDPTFLKSNHWNIGEENKNGPGHFDTTYNLTMQPKYVPASEREQSKCFATSINLKGDGAVNYDTEHSSNYIPKKKEFDQRDKDHIDKVVSDIKNSHFIFGECPSDFQTINGNAYKFDPNKAREARGNLDKALLNDLRATHYKLGYQQFDGTTTQKSDFIPLDMNFKATDDPNLRKSHFNFGDEKSTIHQDDKTIYQTDYVKKPLPKEEDYYY